MHRMNKITMTVRRVLWKNLGVDCMQTVIALNMFPRGTIISQPHRRGDLINLIKVGSSTENLLKLLNPCILCLRGDLTPLNDAENPVLLQRRESVYLIRLAKR